MSGNGEGDRGKLVRLSGLPEDTTENDVREFLDNINILNVYFPRNNTNDCYMEVESSQNLNKMRWKYNSLLNNSRIRYDLVTEAHEINNVLFFMHRNKPKRSFYGVSLRRIPLHWTEIEVEEFLRYQTQEVVINCDPSRTAGEAYVRFATGEDVSRTMQRSGQHVGVRRLEVIRVDEQEFIEYKRRMREIQDAQRQPSPIRRSPPTVQRASQSGQQPQQIFQNSKPTIRKQQFGQHPLPTVRRSQQSVQQPIRSTQQSQATVQKHQQSFQRSQPFVQRKQPPQPLEQPSRQGYEPFNHEPSTSSVDINNSQQNHVPQQRKLSREEQEAEDAKNETSEEELDEETINNLPRLEYELLYDGRHYSAKMASIAYEIRRTAITRAHLGGYNRFEELDIELFQDVLVYGSRMAELMGYPSFEAMCLNAPEIVELFTWKRSRQEFNGRVFYKIENFTAIIPKTYQHLCELQKQRLENNNNDPTWKFVLRYRDKGEFPTNQELATYRRFTPFKTDVNVQRIMKERFHWEISARHNDSKNNLEFKLLHAPDCKLILSTKMVQNECKCFELSDDQLRSIMQKLDAGIEEGLDPQTAPKAAVKMLPSYVRAIPNGSERGDFLALDLGGTNFRVLLIRLEASKSDISSRIFRVPDHVMKGTGEADIDLDVAAVLNDTTGTMMACGFQEPTCGCGVICGTGTNACYMEKTERILKMKSELAASKNEGLPNEVS
ncbi:Phosphotransferase [Aphelenchoides besseyi]|nr:Phosphotransferase [Aphelenchoides besseyi]